MSRGKGKILVIRGGAIGDFILTLPALAALRAQFPDTHIEVLGYPHIASLAKAGGLVDEVRFIESRALAGFFARNAEHDPALIEYFGSFNIIISYLYDPDLVFQTCVAASSSAQFITGPHRPEETGQIHATDVFLRPLEQLAIYGADPVPRLSIHAGTNGHMPAHPTLVMHPGSGSERKNWPEGHWAALVDGLVSDTALQLLLVGGEAEGSRIDRLSSLIPAARGNVLKNVPLVDLAQALQKSNAYIGHDSGISHLAAAVGLKALILWGETNEAIWKPRSERTTLLRHADGLAGIEVEDVLKAAKEFASGSGKV